MTTTVKNLRQHLRQEFEARILACLPTDETILEYTEATEDRDESACLLEDVFEIVSRLRRYHSREEVVAIMGDSGGLTMLLSKWRHRISILVQYHLK